MFGVSRKHFTFTLIIGDIIYITDITLNAVFHVNFCSLFKFIAGARTQSIPGKQQLLTLLSVPVRSMNNHYITVKKETLIV